MRARLYGCLAVLSVAAIGAHRVAQAEVYAETGQDGRFVATHIAVAQGAPSGRVWGSVGAAASRAHVLNPGGDARGDGAPDVAVNPVSGLPRAVWSQWSGSDYEIATSSFDGRAWSSPNVINAPSSADALDPKIVFRADGVAVVTWWEKQPSPRIRLAYALPDGRWTELGPISGAGVKARRPVIRQEGLLTIVAYQTPKTIEIYALNIVTPYIVTPGFTDGPTPFPRGNGDPSGDDGPLDDR